MRFLAAFCLFALIFSFAPAPSAHADSSDQAVVQAMQNYLEGIVTLRARFVQTGNDGRQAGGDFLLKRPGRMRFQYDKPVTDFIVADGSTIWYYDGQMKQASSAPISKSLADFFLRRNLTLSGDLRVSGLARRQGQLELTLVQAQDPLSGSLTLIFGENPIELKAWRVVDGQGQTTEVQLSGTQLGIPIDNKLFRYVDPARSQPFYNER